MLNSSAGLVTAMVPASLYPVLAAKLSEVIGQTRTAGGLGGRGAVAGEVVEDGEGGDGGDVFFAHEAHGFFAELCGVVDGGDAGLGCVERSRLALCVDADRRA